MAIFEKQNKLQLLKKRAFYIISFVVGAFLFSNFGCKPTTIITSNANLIHVDSTITPQQTAEQLIKPYQEKLQQEMNEVLVYSENALIKNKPEGELGNFVADLSMLYVRKYLPLDTVDFCLFNNGGLRTSLPQGAITRGNIFELMPFDNELVIVTITKEKLLELTQYIKTVGGQPVSGIQLYFNQPQDSTYIASLPNKANEQFRVLTTDYLANGGDKMNFFLNPINLTNTNIKLRDAIIQHCIDEQQKGNKISVKIDGRIQFTK